MTREEAAVDIEQNILPIGSRPSLRMAVMALREPKHGEWIKKIDGFPHLVTIEWFVCSECGVQKSEATPFCPNCGARMKEGEAE